jgi:hypothetical protein
MKSTFEYLAQHRIVNRGIGNLTQDFVDSLESEVKQQPGKVIYELDEASRRRVTAAFDTVLRDYGIPQNYEHIDKVKRLVMELLSET